MCDVLPKLELIEQHFNESKEDKLPIAFPKNFLHKSSFQRATLDWYELDYYPLNQYDMISRCVYIPDLAPTGNVRPEFMDRIIKRGLRGRAPVSASRWIYARRKNHLPRSLLNEDEVLPVLKEIGFEIVDWECRDLDEQIEIARSSEVILGPHGANLVNLMFMRPSSLCIEIRPYDDAHNNCYFSLASAVGLKYGYSLHQINDESRFIIDVDVLERDVEYCLNKAQSKNAGSGSMYV